MMLNPSIVQLEISSKCVLKCPRCPHTELKLPHLNQEIAFESFAKAFDKKSLELVKTFVFCGHTGDPIYAKSFLPIISYIKKSSNCQIYVVTNGSYKDAEFWSSLGSLLGSDDCVSFSIDGWDQQSNNQYRKNSDFASISQAIKTLKQSSLAAIKWTSIYFKFNQDHMETIKKIAIDHGCDYFETVLSSKFDGNYIKNGVDDLKPLDKFIASDAVYNKNIFNLSNRQLKSNKTVPIKKHKWARCANHQNEIFLDVKGFISPCPWMATGYQSNDWMNSNQTKLSIHNRSYFEIMHDRNLWDSLQNTWITEPMFICKFKCKNRG